MFNIESIWEEGETKVNLRIDSLPPPVRSKGSEEQRAALAQSGYVNFSKVKFFEIRRPFLPSRWALGDIEEAHLGLPSGIRGDSRALPANFL